MNSFTNYKDTYVKLFLIKETISNILPSIAIIVITDMLTSQYATKISIMSNYCKNVNCL